MRRAVAVLLLIAACLAPGIVKADGEAHHRHRHVAVRVCSVENCLYGEGQFCTIGCIGGICGTQTCHNGHWVIPPAGCAPGFGCPRFC